MYIFQARPPLQHGRSTGDWTLDLKASLYIYNVFITYLKSRRLQEPHASHAKHRQGAKNENPILRV